MNDGNQSGVAEEWTPPIAHLRFLVRAESRVRVVQHLESGPATQRELRAQIDASRTTVSRALQSLVERGWAERSDGAYQLTRVGRAVAGEFTGVLERLETAEELSEFLQWFPDGVETPDLLAADGVEVTYSTADAPYAPARRQTKSLHAADRLRVLLPATDLDSTRTVTEQVTAGDLDIETVVSPGVESTLESEEFAPLMREMTRTERSAVFVAREPLPLYLGLTNDDGVQVGLADDDGIPRALLETTDRSVREWGERVYQTYRNPARRKLAEEF
jgi:predicted transcriptional regulator